MARGNQSSLVLGLSALFYLALLFLPLSFIQTASAEQDPLQESYGTGEILNSSLKCAITGAVADSLQTVIGIDLGTTYSCVGVMQKGKVEILVNDQGHRITPSFVAFTDEERLVGDAAKNQAAANPKRTVFDIK
jgi:endoplasmic reticulum chaperone BiP